MGEFFHNTCTSLINMYEINFINLHVHFLTYFRGFMKTILLILIGNRKDSAVQVQKVLTGWGCMIKTRLGIHDGVMENCSDEGLLVLELYGEREKMKELARKVSLIKGVDSKLIDLTIFGKRKTVKKSVASKTAGKVKK